VDKISFFDSIYHSENNGKQRFFNGIEGYFNLGGRRAYVIPGKMVNGSQEVDFKDHPQSKALRLLKVVSYITGIIPLIMLAAKGIFRATHKFHRVPSAQLLQEGINIKPETIAKIKSCMMNILNEKKKTEGVTFYTSQGNHRVFTLDVAPDLIFKMKASKSQSAGRDDSMKARYQRMIDAKTVCRVNQLGLLIIPNARLFNVEKYEIIAEQKLDITPEESAQEQLFEDHADRLDETVRQLAVFIAKTGFSDVEWRNVPVLNDNVDKEGNRKIALIDIEEMDGAKTGILGQEQAFMAAPRRGLAHCVNEKQMEMVIAEARKQGVTISETEAKAAKERRLKEIASNKALKLFYKEKGIVQGKEPLKVDLSSLGLDLTKTGEYTKIVGVRPDKKGFIREEQSVDLSTVAKAVIAEINKQIQKNSAQNSVKGIRYFVLNPGNMDSTLYDYNKLGLPETVFHTEELQNQWIERIIQALIDKKHLFNIVKRRGFDIRFIQA